MTVLIQYPCCNFCKGVRGPYRSRTMESLLEAAEFVHMVEKRQGVKISAPEEIAYRFGWITKEQLLESAKLYGKSPYGQHLVRVAEARVIGPMVSRMTTENE